MKFAIIPWNSDYLNDGVFSEKMYTDGREIPFIKMRDRFYELGHTIHTIDLFSYDEVDFFLFFILNWDELIKVIKLGKADRLVYCNSEPPSVDKMNTPNGYKVLKKFFPYILTWNDDWIDNVSIFKRNTPYNFIDRRENNNSFDKKKLVTFISSNKKSDFPGELYSERVKAIDFFESEHPDDFEFYGMGWNIANHPCYGGNVCEKSEVYHKYRFAICYENIEGYSGYITEKVFDCITAGIVPIYCGAPDINKYIPYKCLINLRDFTTYEELYNFLKSMSEIEYNQYLYEADLFMKSDKSKEFEGERYTDYIIQAVNVSKKFKVNIAGYVYLLKRKIYLLRIKIGEKI